MTAGCFDRTRPCQASPPLHFQLSPRGRAAENAFVTHEPPATPRRLRLGWWFLAILLAVCAWLGWREYDYRCAVREAEAAGWSWESHEPFDLIIADWHAALQKATWTDRYRQLDLLPGSDLAQARSLIDRLRPTRLRASFCINADIDAIKHLTGLQQLWLPYNELNNVDGLKGLTGLRELNLSHCSALHNTDVLRGLTGLQRLDLARCTALQNVDSLKWLTGLQELGLSDCTALQNVDSLKGLTWLQELYLGGCTAIPATTLRELRAALPKTHILFPDHTGAPPP